MAKKKKSLWKKNKREIRFLLLFLLFFVLFQFVYWLSRDITAPIIVDRMSAGVSSWIINLITPGERAFAFGRSIRSGTFIMVIAPGCEGIEGIFLVSSGILAFCMSLRQKLLGVLVGAVVMYLLNLIRLVSLYYICRFQPHLSDLMHTYVWQIITIFAGMLFFVFWISSVRGSDEKAA